MDFKNKSKEEILQHYVDTVKVGSTVYFGTDEGVTCDIPVMRDGDIVVQIEDTDGASAILWISDEGIEGYKLKEGPKAGLNDTLTIQNDKEVRDAELKEKAFEIYKYCTLDETDESLMDEHAAYAYRVAEVFINYTHKNHSK